MRGGPERAHRSRTPEGAQRPRGRKVLALTLLLTPFLTWPQLGLAQEPAGLSFPDGWVYPAGPRTAEGRQGMVSSTDALATRVGIETLQRGGHAVDAAVAVAFALAVTHPAAGNLGGGGFLVLRTDEGESYALDFREKAPSGATRDMYLAPNGALTNASVLGHLAAGVPGSVMGLWEAHQRFGRLPWPTLLDPAIALAEGFIVGEELARSLAEFRADLEIFSPTREHFLAPDGSPLSAGATFRQPALARTLRRIRDEGPDGFYRGETAGLIVTEMERGGGIITLADLGAYEAVWRDPIRFSYRGYTVHSMPPSSSGGATLALMAQILEPFDLGALEWQSPQHIHLLAEAWKLAYADRNQVLADPDFVPLPLPRMISPEYAAERSSRIRVDQATPSLEIGPGLEIREGLETTHLSVVDREGNAVALTTTLNSSYGSKVLVAGAGFLLNNEMDDFAARPGFPNQFGLVQGAQNAIEPGKRMLSAMTPTVVEDADGALFLVTGTPGGATIITTVFQSISNVIDFGMEVGTAVHAPRVHHQHLPDRIEFEVGGLRTGVAEGLRALGHTVEERTGISGDVQMILVRPDGTLTGHADPRRGGLALGY